MRVFLLVAFANALAFLNQAHAHTKTKTKSKATESKRPEPQTPRTRELALAALAKRRNSGEHGFWHKKTPDEGEVSLIPPELASETAEKETDISICDPPCIEENGHCHNNVCYCKDGWTGSKCAEPLEIKERVSMSLTCGLVGAAFACGMLVAVIISELSATIGNHSYKKVEGRKEAWTPAGRAE